MSGLVQIARYISAPITLRYGTSGPNNFSLSSLGQKRFFSLQVNELSSKKLMDVIYPYESDSRLSLYMLTNKLTFYLKSTRFAGRGKILFSKIFISNLVFKIVNYSCKLFRSSNKIQIFHIYHNDYKYLT